MVISLKKKKEIDLCACMNHRTLLLEEFVISMCLTNFWCKAVCWKQKQSKYKKSINIAILLEIIIWYDHTNGNNLLEKHQKAIQKFKLMGRMELLAVVEWITLVCGWYLGCTELEINLFFSFLCFMGLVQMKLYPAEPISPLEYMSKLESDERRTMCTGHRKFAFTEPAR